MKVSVSIEDTTSKRHALGRCVPLSIVSYALQEHRVQGLDATLAAIERFVREQEHRSQGIDATSARLVSARERDRYA